MRALSDMQKAHRKAVGTAQRRAQSRTRLSCSADNDMISQFCSVHNSRLCILHVCQITLDRHEIRMKPCIDNAQKGLFFYEEKTGHTGKTESQLFEMDQ